MKWQLGRPREATSLPNFGSALTGDDVKSARRSRRSGSSAGAVAHGSTPPYIRYSLRVHPSPSSDWLPWKIWVCHRSCTPATPHPTISSLCGHGHCGYILDLTLQFPALGQKISITQTELSYEPFVCEPQGCYSHRLGVHLVVCGTAVLALTRGIEPVTLLVYRFTQV